MASNPIPVAQYLRMSTDKQEYSVLNQKDAIASYANAHSMLVVSTYIDEGLSGLGIRKRKALQRLIRDVHSDPIPFRAVLVYDVSRWGRFQDVDESAYYEYMCRRAGAPVVYCAELFNSDPASPMDSVIKAIKRAMAAEYSRELGEKVLASQLRVARLGFHPGGRPQYGLQRLLMDSRGRSKCLLTDGQPKNVKTDRVILTTGLKHEVRIVKLIFRWYLSGELGTKQIAERLNKRKIPTKLGALWNSSSVGELLRSERYAGVAYFNRKTARLGSRRKWNGRECWITVPVRGRIVSRAEFDRARQILSSRRTPRYSESEMLQKLQELLAAHGRITPELIARKKDMPKVSSYHRRFGSLVEAYRRINYTPARSWVAPRADCNRRASKLRSDLIAECRRALELAGFHCKRSPSTATKILAGSLPLAIVCRRTAPQCSPPSKWTAPYGLITLIGQATPDGSELLACHVYDRSATIRHWRFMNIEDAIQCLVDRVRAASDPK